MLSHRFLPLSLGFGLCFFTACAQPETGDNGAGGDTGSGGETGVGSGGHIAGSGGATGSGGVAGSGSGGHITGGGGMTGSGGVTGAGGHLGTGGVIGAGGAVPAVGGTSGSGGVTGGGTGGRTAAGGNTGSSAGGTTGTTTMSGLPVPPGSANVSPPTGNATTVTVINWAGFKSAVTFSFDDDNDSQIADYPMLQAAGGQYTFFMWTNRSQAMNAIWKQALKDGHEIGNHTLSHDPNSHCTAADIKSASDFIMSNLGVTAQTFAAPNGNTCFSTPASMYFFIDRGTGPATPVMPNDNSNPLNLNCYIPDPSQPLTKFKTQIDGGHTAGGWVIYVVHGFSMTDGSYQPVNISDMTGAITYAKGLNDMWVGAMVNVGAYWVAQKAVKNAMTSTAANGDKTWTWTLPAHFPAGHYLRVTTDGGTLKQNGTALAWDPHGYYEIALDAGSVTLSK
jgi:hypothetical protein